MILADRHLEVDIWKSIKTYKGYFAVQLLFVHVFMTSLCNLVVYIRFLQKNHHSSTADPWCGSRCCTVGYRTSQNSDMAPVLYVEEPELGDLIEIDRGLYQHWAVYVGDGFVANLASPFGGRGGQSSSVRSLVADQAVVKREELWDVVRNDQWRINNSLDNKYQPHPSHVIVKAACELVGQQRPYCVLSDNCEHFVNYLRYGKAVSLQVCNRILSLVSGLFKYLLFGIVAGAGALCMI
ncbi:phospholipase A and acyltransferase 3-like isoform X2 [Takifugu flavidus]|uniref:phospholipase A and acyltransferase 3-like isoform X2 n=2 Tax=Takifugu flavidus TaxID=433684 RepID=UPI0025447223|nr:phospholipase A and acyltransferase 3-like isoform X2 [Takifugu flavidus]